MVCVKKIYRESLIKKNITSPGLYLRYRHQSPFISRQNCKFMRKTRHGNLCHIWPRYIPSTLRQTVTNVHGYVPNTLRKTVTYDHGYVPSTLRKAVSQMTTDMFQVRYGNLCHVWPRICSKYVTEDCVTYDHEYVPSTLRKTVTYDHGYVPNTLRKTIPYDHGYVPSTLRTIVSQMTTDMFQVRYGKLCHIWPRICSNHVTENCVTYDHGYVPSTLRKPVSQMATDMFRFSYSQWDSCCSIISFLWSALWIIVCPFVLFHLTIALSVLLRLLNNSLVSSSFSYMITSFL